MDRIGIESARSTVGIFALGLLAVGAGCKSESTTARDAAVSPSGEGSPLHSPQAVAVSERWILVGNTGFHYDGDDGRPAWAAGSVSFVDRGTRRVVGRVVTSQKNPQSIVVAGQRAYVLNGGELRRGELDGGELEGGEGPYVPGSAGGIDVIDLSGGVPREVAVNIALPLPAAGDRRVGAFRSLVVIDGAAGRRAYVGSGTRGDLFVVDLDAGRVLRGTDRPIALIPTAEGDNGMSIVRPWGAGGLAVLDFNGDRLCLFAEPGAPDRDLDRAACHPVGVNRELLEGPLDVAFADDGAALVLMSLANAVYRVELAGPGEPPTRIDHRFATTGLANNRLRVLEGQRALLVVNSLSNNLQRVALDAGASRSPFAVLPVGSNPYDLAISREAGGPRGWVSLLGSHQLALVDLDSGELLELIGAGSSAVADGGSGAGDGQGGVTDGGAGDAGAVADGDAGAPGCAFAEPVIGIDAIVSASYGPGAGYGQSELPAAIQGGPEGLGEGAGAVRGVLSLGTEGELIVDFGAHEIVDGPGPDFIVFENPLLLAPQASNAEPARVAVSAAGTADGDFVEFSCDLTAAQGDPTGGWPYPGCAGVRPVKANRQNCIDPRDPLLAGGDAFDLAELGLPRARYLRLRDAGVAKIGTNARGFDLDAVVLIHAAAR